MDWKWRPPFSPGRLSPSTLFFGHVFPLKLSNTMCFTLGFVLRFAIVTSFPYPPQNKCFPPPQNCPFVISGFCLIRVLHLIHLSVRSIVTFSTIFDDYDQKKQHSPMFNAGLGFVCIWIFCFVSSFYYVMEARNSEYQKGLQNVYYDTKKIIKLKDSADNNTESDTKSDHEKGAVLIGTNQIWR